MITEEKRWATFGKHDELFLQIFAVGSERPLMSYLLGLLLVWTAMILGIMRLLQRKPEAPCCRPAKKTESQRTQTVESSLANVYTSLDSVQILNNETTTNTPDMPWQQVMGRQGRHGRRVTNIYRRDQHHIYSC